MTVYAKPGESLQQIGGACPPEFIEMAGPRPDGEYVAGADGAWVAVPEVQLYPQLSALEMLDLFTEAEQLAVVQATMSAPEVKLWYDRMIAATFVTYEDPRTEGGLQALVTAGLLTPERKAEIVAAMQPAIA